MTEDYNEKLNKLKQKTMKKKNEDDILWRDFMENPFLHADDLQDEKGCTVTITGYSTTQGYSKKTKKEETLKLMHLAEFEKPLVMSNRKSEQIKALFGKFRNQSIGKKVRLYFINEKIAGKQMDVLTFKKEVEIEKDVLNSKHKNWEAAKGAVKNGKTTVDAIEKHYKISAAVRKELEELIPKK